MPEPLARMSPSELAQLSDEQLEESLISYVSEIVCAAPNEIEALAAFPEAIQNWYPTAVLDIEVLNGGFNQFFFNSSSAYAEMLPDACRKVGIPEVGALVAEGTRLLTKHADALHAAEKAGTIDAFFATYIDAPFEHLDDQYAAREDEWHQCRVGYLRSVLDTLAHPR
ncbi:MAG: DUF4375 domain-containing protein [Clostridia bacterium]|nr:DUF4375 domain-containing protein [Deltaproteobacteria bacterium]